MVEVLEDRGRLKVKTVIVNGIEFYATSNATFVCKINKTSYEIPYEMALAIRDHRFAEFMDHKEVMPVMGPCGGLARTILDEQTKAQAFYSGLSKEMTDEKRKQREKQELIRRKAIQYQIEGGIPVGDAYRYAKIFYGVDPGPVIGAQKRKKK